MATDDAVRYLTGSNHSSNHTPVTAGIIATPVYKIDRSVGQCSKVHIEWAQVAWDQ